MVNTNGTYGVVNYFKDSDKWTVVNQVSGGYINDGITLNEISNVHSPQTSNVLFFDNSDNYLLYSNSFMNDLVSQTSTLKALITISIKLQKYIMYRMYGFEQLTDFQTKCNIFNRKFG